MVIVKSVVDGPAKTGPVKTDVSGPGGVTEIRYVQTGRFPMRFFGVARIYLKKW